ncbi:hypothetical protein F7734_52200 [Scytonema sp. UIC 10036]|nr:hypothetical protein [Scytonema sp. UIC 10036]
MHLLWFIPTHGDGRYLGTAIGGRGVSDLNKIAVAPKTKAIFNKTAIVH